MGQQTIGPTTSAVKFYVRRKGNREFNVEAQSVLEPPIQITLQNYEASSKEYTRDPSTSICDQASLEKQMALVGDMGLTYGQETQKVMDFMIQLEQRDKVVAVERGIMNHH